ncbi:hypothetical protein PVIIG_04219 [Plasmodium vivax India VII]|uniref:VIR protein n=1 Tax=Plasmodium vivax India VII TaxID=1077284 RepID=A0A0J9SAV6_PLAVI|nr:hypothetical protein PVIIG_04219 [Plasmodium vivax India VII]
MGESFYDAVSDFPIYKDILYNSTDSQGTDHSTICASINKKSFKSGYDNCSKVLKYLKHIQGNGNGKDNYIAKGCKYLNYWLYDEEHSQYVTTNNISDFYNELQQSSNHYLEPDLCKDDFKKIEEYIFKDIKELYNLYENLYRFHYSHSTRNSCHNVETCVQIYEKYKNDCLDGKNKKLCNELENFRLRYNDVMKLKDECNGVKKMLPPYKAYNLTVIITIPVTATLVISFVAFILNKVKKIYI